MKEEYFITFYTDSKIARLYFGRTPSIQDPMYTPLNKRVVISAFFEKLNEGYIWEFIDKNDKIIDLISR